MLDLTTKVNVTISLEGAVDQRNYLQHPSVRLCNRQLMVANTWLNDGGGSIFGFVEKELLTAACFRSLAFPPTNQLYLPDNFGFLYGDKYDTIVFCVHRHTADSEPDFTTNLTWKFRYNTTKASDSLHEVRQALIYMEKPVIERHGNVVSFTKIHPLTEPGVMAIALNNVHAHLTNAAHPHVRVAFHKSPESDEVVIMDDDVRDDMVTYQGINHDINKVYEPPIELNVSAESFIEVTTTYITNDNFR